MSIFNGLNYIRISAAVYTLVGDKEKYDIEIGHEKTDAKITLLSIKSIENV
jgi:hypothetical protein